MEETNSCSTYEFVICSEFKQRILMEKFQLKINESFSVSNLVIKIWILYSQPLNDKEVYMIITSH